MHSYFGTIRSVQAKVSIFTEQPRGKRTPRLSSLRNCFSIRPDGFRYTRTTYTTPTPKAQRNVLPYTRSCTHRACQRLTSINSKSEPELFASPENGFRFWTGAYLQSHLWSTTFCVTRRCQVVYCARVIITCNVIKAKFGSYFRKRQRFYRCTSYGIKTTSFFTVHTSATHTLR